MPALIQIFAFPFLLVTIVWIIRKIYEKFVADVTKKVINIIKDESINVDL